MTTHFLRNEFNDTIVDIEASKDDIHVVVDITNFSQHLLDLQFTLKLHFIRDMATLQELRGIYFETPEIKETPNQLARLWCEKMVKSWGLSYVTD